MRPVCPHKWLYISSRLGFHQILNIRGMRLRDEGAEGAGLPPSHLQQALGKSGNASVWKSLWRCPDLRSTKIILSGSYRSGLISLNLPSSVWPTVKTEETCEG